MPALVHHIQAAISIEATFDHGDARESDAETEVYRDSLALISTMIDQAMRDLAASTAAAIVEVVEPATTVELGNGTRYHVGSQLPVLFRDGAPLNPDALECDTVRLAAAESFDAWAFIAELPALTTALATDSRVRSETATAAIAEVTP